MIKDHTQTILPIEELLAAARGSRSPLDVYYEANHAELLEGLARAGGRVQNWQAVADVLAKRGIMDADGNPPSKETARQTWIRVNRRLQAKQKAKPRKLNGQTVEARPLPEQVSAETTPLFRSVSEPKGVG